MRAVGVGDRDVTGADGHRQSGRPGDGVAVAAVENDVADRLRGLLEDRIPEGERAELARHLDICENCRQALEGMEKEPVSWSTATRLPRSLFAATSSLTRGLSSIP